ncbi:MULTISPECIES: type II toxin-antitoxin system VapC family toxin [unclassified Nocardia]|uniref:type II toxin-antitoxin system VapC family toxin n=1 Tax=unclassified Nocardia TaxID=2637762 RepID=UPI001CE47AA6|nr:MULTISPECIES: type II toxin-antitoxin system VapC family toxin [unclassified Nocardia]
MTLPRQGLLDTNVLILMDGLDQDELPAEQAISALTLAELSVGPLATDDPEEVAARMAVLGRTEAEFEPIPFTAAAARAFGRVYAATVAVGRKPRRYYVDLLIASTAIANKLPLFTVNPDDFLGLERLLVVHPVTHPDNRS